MWVYHCDSLTFEYLVYHDVQNPTQAVVYDGIPGINGTALFTLSRATSPIYGSQILTDGYQFLLFNQTLFINIESQQFPDGEIIGPISTQYPYYAYLSGTYVVPPVTTSSVGIATLSMLTNSTFDYDIQFSVPYPIEVRLSQGPEGINGPINRLFPTNTTPVIGAELELTASEINTLNNGLFYIEISSEAYPIDGEIRGQIYTVNASCESRSPVAPITIIFPPPPYFPIFTGDAAVPTASILALLLVIIALILQL